MFCLFISTANPRSKALSARRFPIPACGTRAQPRFMYDAIQQNYLVNITIHQYAPLSPVFRLFSTTFCPPSQRAYWERPIPSSGVMLMTKLTILKNIISMGFFKAKVNRCLRHLRAASSAASSLTSRWDCGRTRTHYWRKKQNLRIEHPYRTYSHTDAEELAGTWTYK